MDFISYRETIARIQSSRFTPRQRRLNALSRVLHRKQYSHISNAFSQERQGNGQSGKRILLDDRRPSVQDPLAVELVRDQCGLLFGEDHRPIILARDDEDTTKWMSAFIKDTKFWLTLTDALWKGSPGSCAIVLRVLGKEKEYTVPAQPESGQEEIKEKRPDGPGRYYFEVWAGEECRPIFDRSAPDTLLELDRRYFIGEDALKSQGYDYEGLMKYWDTRSAAWRQGAKRTFQKAGGDLVNDWVIRLTLKVEEEVWYKPIPKFIYERKDWDDSQWQIDEDRTSEHELGKVTAEWVRPLPVDADEYYPDGACLFEPVIDFQYRIDRTLSQIGRAFDYAGDPQMARIRAANSGGLPGGSFGTGTAMGGTASDVIEVDEKGEAKFVEITGEGLRVAVETYVSALEDIAKRAGAMSRIAPESSTGASAELSSVAMRLLNTAQLTLSGILRITCGEMPGAPLLKLAMKMWKELDVELPSLKGQKVEPNPDAALEFQWPDYYEPIGQEKLAEVNAINAAYDNGGISKETQIANLAPLFDVTSTNDEGEKIKTDQADQLIQKVAEANELGAVEAKYGEVKSSIQVSDKEN